MGENMRKRNERAVPVLAVVAALLLGLVACAVNPATGKRQLVFVSEPQEIEMGRKNDEGVVEQFGLYEDEDLQRYVQDLGSRLAARSERPELEWTFRVVDDPLVNAFALPGGYIYVTRGILAHFNSEAELVSVLGHEIGHVTARHSVNQMSKAMLGQVGLGVGMIVWDDLRQYGDLASASLGILFLKFSRDDERQADELGLRYLMATGYDPRPMAEVFATLGRVSDSGGGNRPPGWMSTHPDPGNREEHTRQAIASTGRSFSNATVRRREYLARIENLAFGDDPRHGFFQQERFFHPEMEFQLDFPGGWKLQNMRQLVGGISPGEDAIIRLTLSKKKSAEAGLKAFFDQDGVVRTGSRNGDIHGLDASLGTFTASSGGSGVKGQVAFVEHQGKVFRILGYSADSRWSDYKGVVDASLSSFRRLTERQALEVRPKRLHIVRVDRTMTAQEFASHYRATEPPEKLAVLNGLDPGESFQAGQFYKVVQGGELP
jgi:predicted Zn-dependent protease